MTHTRINKIFQKATRKALVGWETDLDGTELINELWAWYLERPYVQKKFEELGEGELVKFARRQTINMLSAEAKSNDLFGNKGRYSSDSVRAALRGESTNRYLGSILPTALNNLGRKNAGQAEAIRLRYTDGLVPAPSSAEAAKLKRAVKSLTEHVNIIALTAGVGGKEGPRLRRPIDPDVRSSGGVHSDPTANIALALIDHPELREEFLEEQPITEYLRGPGA